MTNYKLNDEKMFADIADKTAIIINTETGVYYGMNNLGTEIYTNLVNGVPSEKILEKLMEWDSSSKEFFDEYMDFIIKNEIVVVSSIENDAELKIDENTAKDDNYHPKAAEYMDAQELLLADPIHEVKEEEGWSPQKSSLNEDKDDVARREAKMLQK